MIQADKIGRGEITDPKEIKKRQSSGFAAVKALQQRAKAARK